jgi:ribonuclease P/MRP protein subunit RPP40
VVIERCQFALQKVISGVPEGSVLGPILFLIYINYIDSVCCGDPHLQLFADDTKLYSSIGIGSPSVSLQESLDNSTSWANAWQLKINIGKFAVMSLRSKSLSSDFVYFIDGISISAHTSYIDLGITISQDLSFRAHNEN